MIQFNKKTNDSTETKKTTVSPPTRLQTKSGARKYDNDDKEDIGRNTLDLLVEAANSNLMDDSSIPEKESPVLEGEVISPLAKKRHKKIDYPSKPSATKKGPKEQTPKVILKDVPIYSSVLPMISLMLIQKEKVHTTKEN